MLVQKGFVKDNNHLECTASAVAGPCRDGRCRKELESIDVLAEKVEKMVGARSAMCYEVHDLD